VGEQLLEVGRQDAQRPIGRELADEVLAKSGMSCGRSRSGGTAMRNTASR
jgi:hypothetical protein